MAIWWAVMNLDPNLSGVNVARPEVVQGQANDVILVNFQSPAGPSVPVKAGSFHDKNQSARGRVHGAATLATREWGKVFEFQEFIVFWNRMYISYLFLD